MICSFCRAKNKPGATFCNNCGIKLNKQICDNCGSFLSEGSQFCNNCGKAISNIPHKSRNFSQIPPTLKYPSKASGKASKSLIVSLILVSVLAVSSVLSLILLPSAQETQGLNLGKTTAQINETVPADGGEIYIDDNSSVINGLSIFIPENAYPKEMDYEISTTQILSHDYGDFFNPITPLITIDNGHKFAEEPMEITIPIEKDDDEFAMAFYYDEETGELEGIPFWELENHSITIITAHFSKIVVSKIVKESIMGALKKGLAIDSGFEPGFNDFQMPNNGSIICTGGHCAGQSIAAMYYYNNRERVGWDKFLNGRFDNNEYEKTPELIWDDAFSMRLCSVIQKDFESQWRIKTFDTHQKDDDVFFAFAYSILMTKQPQFIGIKSTNSGHAMIVYKVTGDALYIADPNFPGDVRKIKYRIQNNKVDLESYFSGDDCEQATTNSKEYNVFNYHGLYSLIDKSKVSDAWNKVKKDKDPGTNLFPADATFTVKVIKNEAAGDFYETPLEDGMIVYQSQVSEIGKNLLSIYPTGEYQAGDKFYFYKDDSNKYFELIKQAGQNVRFDANNLKLGNNNIGILHMRKISVIKDGQTKIKEKFVNFYRFNIIIKADPMLSVSPETANAFVGDIIPFSATADNMPNDAVFIWNFGDGNIISTYESDYQYAYSSEGTYSGEVSIVNEDSLETLATAYFSVVVFEEEVVVTTPTQSSVPSPTPSPTNAAISEVLLGKWYATSQDNEEYVLEFFGDGTATFENITDPTKGTAKYTIDDTHITLYFYNVDGEAVHDDSGMAFDYFEGHLNGDVYSANGLTFYK